MKKIFFLSFLFLLLFGSVQTVSAAEACCVCKDQKLYRVQEGVDGCTAWCQGQGSDILLSSTATDNLKKYCNIAGTGSSGGSGIPNPLGTTDVNTFVGRLISYALGLVGTISLLLFVYGGLIWMTSAGSPEKVKKGRDILVWAVIGMAIVFMSYILVKFVIQGLQGVL
jgi:hypothetical protein